MEIVETDLHKIRKVTDRGLLIVPYKQSKMSTMDKIVSRESLLNRYDSSGKLFRNLDNRIRQSTLIDGEDKDRFFPDDFSIIQEDIDYVSPETSY